MPLARKDSRLRGWETQAERLTLKHSVVARGLWASSEEAPRAAPSEPVSFHSPPSGAKTDFDQLPSQGTTEGNASAAENQAAREAAATWISTTRRDILAAKAANKKITELQVELDAAIEQITCLGIENQSLRSSLDLALNDSARSDRDLSRLKELLHQAEDRFHRLESDHSAALFNTKKLLQTCKTREGALVRAEEKLKSLIELFVRLESEITDAPARPEVEQSSEQQDSALEAVKDTNAPEPRRPPLWQRELDTDDWLLKPRNML